MCRDKDQTMKKCKCGRTLILISEIDRNECVYCRYEKAKKVGEKDESEEVVVQDRNS